MLIEVINYILQMKPYLELLIQILPRRNLFFCEICLQLNDPACYSTTNMAYDTNDNSKTETQYRYKRFYSPKIHFAGSQEGKEKFTLYRGRYSWPFQIHLADHLSPLTSPPQIYPRVAYYLYVIIKKS